MMSQSAGSVTVMGLGSMGQAMVRSLCASGTKVTVWNRSPEKAGAVVEFGAVRADTVGQALSAGEVIVLSLTDYPAMYDVLEPVAEHLAGKTIVNLSSDSPESTRKAGAWIRARGGRFLAGGVMADSDGVGSSAAYIFYSGPRDVFAACADALRPLGRPEYLGEDDGIAQLYYQAVLAMFLPGLLAFEQALAMIDRSGESIERFLPYAQRSMGDMADLYAAVAAMAATGGWRDIAHLRMMAAGAQHVVQTATAAGVDTALAHAVRTYWHRALTESERTGVPVSTFQLLRGETSSLNKPEYR
ncbi:NAD(P)-binding domain-containing protein [Nocardia sp. NBC_00508]|uniref:NAD(P)-dependent oxidoreductase n=1 Tax=Nocardia sp. NBC_00508 TaxID=2975992 RepID=UPI002E7FC4FF|nr:NAD(P)-binding domain-containing protein [Nocardia sp. NBC_00508]WUD67037.1 NAD(P)-binding domain-containing protein [Nocardia sp. NBC_00508]